jgi:hypothetical protein
VCRLLVQLGLQAPARTVLAAMGFEWSEDGLTLVGLVVEASASVMPNVDTEGWCMLVKLIIFLASQQTAALDAEVGAWIPAPVALAEYERERGYFMSWGSSMNLLSLAARAFIRLGRDADAEEAARIAVSPAHGTRRKYDLVECHTVLGEVAARRGEMEEANGHFARALAEARASRLPMLELLAARDWKRAVGAGGGAAGAEAVIDGACAAMGKSRAQLAGVLAA